MVLYIYVYIYGYTLQYIYIYIRYSIYYIYNIYFLLYNHIISFMKRTANFYLFFNYLKNLIFHTWNSHWSVLWSILWQQQSEQL